MTGAHKHFLKNFEVHQSNHLVMMRRTHLDTEMLFQLPGCIVYFGLVHTITHAAFGVHECFGL